MTGLRGTALVTGASSGIGRAAAELLSARGVRVALTGRDATRLAESAASLSTQPRPVVLQHDLSAPDAAVGLAARALAELGGLDVLVHAAGALRLGGVEQAAPEDLDALYAVNLRAPVVLTRALLPALRASRGSIVFVNSSAAIAPGATNGLYAATKAGLAAFAKGLREEVSGDGIRVLSVFPGRTASPMQAAVFAFEGAAYRPEELLQPRDVAVAIVDALALPATAEITDLFIRPARKPMRQEGTP